MKKIQILGTGCPKCERLANNAQMALHQLGVPGEVLKVKDLKEIMQFGVMITPGLVIDGEVKSSGKVLSVEEIRDLLQ
jgi:small redox-active disulfide protein 2